MVEDTEKGHAVSRLPDEDEVLAKKLADELENEEFIKRAGAYDGLPIKPEEFGPVLKRLHKGEATAEDMAELDRIFVFANTKMALRRDKWNSSGLNIGLAGSG